MDVVVYDDEDKRYVPLLVAALLALLAAVVVGGLSYELGRSQPVEQIGAVSQPQPGTVVGDQPCGEAIERADAALGVGGRLQQSLSEHTVLMNELLAQRATSEEVLERALPPLTASVKDRQAYLDAVMAYQQARDQCGQ